MTEKIPTEVERQLLSLTTTATKMFNDKGADKIVIQSVIDCFKEGLNYKKLKIEDQKLLDIVIERLVNVALTKSTATMVKDLMSNSNNQEA